MPPELAKRILSVCSLLHRKEQQLSKSAKENSNRIPSRAAPARSGASGVTGVKNTAGVKKASAASCAANMEAVLMTRCMSKLKQMSNELNAM